jgi:biotin carboxylase
MNFVFLSPSFPPQYQWFCKALRARGVNVLGMGDTPTHELSHELRGWLTEYVHVQNLLEGDQALRGLAYLTWKHGKIDRLDSLNEHWLELEGSLRDAFHIEGPKRAETIARRSKAEMKAVFRSAGIPVPAGQRVRSSEELSTFVQAHGLPIVIKPESGVGAAGAFKVSTQEELKRIPESQLHGVVVEEFIDGKIVSFDGLTDRQGNIVFCVSHVYSAGIMEVVTRGLDIHYYTRRQLSPKLEEFGRKAVTAFAVKEQFFHFEFFELADGSYRALEGNFRPPGGFTTDMMNYACDLDIYDLWARVVSGGDVSGFKFERKYFCAHAARRHTRRYRVPHEALVKELGSALIIHREMPPVFSGAMGNEMYLLRHPDEKELLRLIGLIESVS